MRFCHLPLAAALIAGTVCHFAAGITEQRETIPSRAPFKLELPELNNQITEPVTKIATADLHVLRFRVVQPFADSIDYGRIYITINGESAGVITDVLTLADGKVATCNIDRNPKFRLRQGKNVLEVTAFDRNKREYYASYVLLAGSGSMDYATLATGATVETKSVVAGLERTPPTIILTEPRGPIERMKTSRTILVGGIASDESGKISWVSVNGLHATLSPAASTRGLFVHTGSLMPGAMVFRQPITIFPTTSEVVIEAADHAGNVSRMVIPIRGQEASLSSEFTGRKFALIIGVSRYKYKDGGLIDLRYADADARALREFLQQPAGGRFKADDIVYLENEQATLATVRGALNQLASRATANDLLFIFIASHGAPDPSAPKNLYFLLHDSKVADMPDTALRMEELKNYLDDSLQAERAVVLVDTCHSAGLSGEKLVTTRALENNLINLYAAKLYNEKGRALLTSSDVNEVSQEGQRWGGGHGVFTFALLEGLRGAADFNHDKTITAGELFSYVRERVQMETAFEQNPTALPGLNQNLRLAVAAK